MKQLNQKRKAVMGLVGVVTVFGVGSLGSPAWAATTTTSTTSFSPNAKADVIRATAACVGSNSVVSGEMLVDGQPVAWGDGKVNIQGGSTVTVNFTVAPGCDPTQFGLAAYENPVGNPDPTYEEVDQQTYLTSQVVTLQGGQSGTLSLTLPETEECFYQVDFFTGEVLLQFGTGIYYGSPEGRLISVVHVEKPDCDVEVDETSTTTTSTPSTTTTSTSQVTTSTSTSTSTTSTTEAEVGPDETRPSTLPEDAEVLGESIDRPSGEEAEVLGESLARTGSDSLTLAGWAAALAFAGGSLRVAATALRRRKA